MFTASFSTVACHDWTFDRIAAAADEYGYEGVELRSRLDEGGCAMACEPGLTDPDKVRKIFEREGVDIVGVASSVSFDEPISPPILGRALSDTEKQIRAGKRHVELAREIGAPFMRVFGFDTPYGERREMVIRRIAERLRMVVDDARHSGVRVVLENGGGFPRAIDIKEILDRIDSPLCGACYSLAPGVDAGDSPQDAINTLGEDLLVARLKDVDAAGAPVLLGDGVQPCQAFARALLQRGFDGPLVYEWDRMWLPDLAAPEEALAHAAKRIYGWVSTGAPAPAMA